MKITITDPFVSGMIYYGLHWVLINWELRSEQTEACLELIKQCKAMALAAGLPVYTVRFSYQLGGSVATDPPSEGAEAGGSVATDQSAPEAGRKGETSPAAPWGARDSQRGAVHTAAGGGETPPESTLSGGYNTLS